MEQGLAVQMVYGDGKNQNTKHHYAGTKKKGCGCSGGTPHTPRRKKRKCGCKACA